MPCIISDIAMNIAANNTSVPLAGVTVFVQPSAVPVFTKVLDHFREIANPQRSIITDENGAWSLTLPWPSETDPKSTLWRITTPDLVVWEGAIPEFEDGPVTLHQLKAHHGWVQIVP